MMKEIKVHLVQQLKVLEDFQNLLEQESEILKKGTSDEILTMVHEKESFIRLLNELEAKRLHLVKQKTFQQLIAEYPEDVDFQSLYQRYRTCCQRLQDLVSENEELTRHAYQVTLDRMAFCTELVREAKGAQQTYARGGQYQKASSIGSTIIERTL